MTGRDMVETVSIGAVTGAHGVRGQFKVKPFTTMPKDIASYGPVYVGQLTLTLSIKGQTSNGLVIVAAREISDRDAAAALRGQELTVARSALPEVADDEIYHADLLGMEVSAPNGEIFGSVLAIHDFGAGEIVEVKPVSGPSIMLPFDSGHVVEIDVETARIVLTPPQGLLDPSDEKRG